MAHLRILVTGVLEIVLHQVVTFVSEVRIVYTGGSPLIFDPPFYFGLFFVIGCGI